MLAGERRREPAGVGAAIGRYQVLALLGAGGMGEVYLAQDTRLGRKVALKLLPALSPATRERLRRFEQEARAASALNHPNIITIHEIGEADGAHFIATEFVEGETLRERLAARRRSTLAEALDDRHRRSPPRSPRRTRRASSTATSSPRTSWCGPTAT